MTNPSTYAYCQNKIWRSLIWRPSVKSPIRQIKNLAKVSHYKVRKIMYMSPCTENGVFPGGGNELYLQNATSYGHDACREHSTKDLSRHSIKFKQKHVLTRIYSNQRCPSSQIGSQMMESVMENSRRALHGMNRLIRSLGNVGWETFTKLYMSYVRSSMLYAA